MTREYAEQLALWWRWRNDGMENTTVIAGPMAPRVENPHASTNGHAPRPIDLDVHTRNNGGTVMADNGISAPTGAGTADNVTTPALRKFYEENAARWAQLQDNVTAVADWCRQATANIEGIVGGLTADRHDPATLAEAHQVLDSVQQTGRIAEQFATAVEQTQTAFAKAAQGLERARSAEDAHQAFAGGPAKNFDAYAQS
jgi:hypothetical protein